MPASLRCATLHELGCHTATPTLWARMAHDRTAAGQPHTLTGGWPMGRLVASTTGPTDRKLWP
eukprot:6025260-Lingulodinium_polyedra.AAC.1